MAVIDWRPPTSTVSPPFFPNLPFFFFKFYFRQFGVANSFRGFTLSSFHFPPPPLSGKIPLNFRDVGNIRFVWFSTFYINKRFSFARTCTQLDVLARRRRPKTSKLCQRQKSSNGECFKLIVECWLGSPGIENNQVPDVKLFPFIFLFAHFTKAAQKNRGPKPVRRNGSFC